MAETSTIEEQTEKLAIKEARKDFKGLAKELGLKTEEDVVNLKLCTNCLTYEAIGKHRLIDNRMVRLVIDGKMDQIKNPGLRGFYSPNPGLCVI